MLGLPVENDAFQDAPQRVPFSFEPHRRRCQEIADVPDAVKKLLLRRRRFGGLFKEMLQLIGQPLNL